MADSGPKTTSIQTRPTGAKWGQTRRLEFIDFRLRWDGRFNRSDLTGFFGISIPQASLDIAEYSKRAPENLIYDKTEKLYVRGALFRALFPSSSLKHYLDDLLQTSGRHEIPYGSFLGWHPPVARVAPPARHLRSEVVIAVVRAIRNKQSVEVRYHSSSVPEPTVRTVSPHALAFDGFRWHMRAYCHLRSQYRDFSLSRVATIRDGVAEPVIGEQDIEWNTIVKLVLTPHPGLDENHRRMIELDFGMHNGACEYECRQALLFYALQQLRLDDVETSNRSPESQQIVLANREELASYLPRMGHR